MARLDKQGNVDPSSVSPEIEHTLRQYNPYAIVYEKTLPLLVTSVNDMAIKGFTPTGGVIHDGANYVQAMFYTSRQPIERRYQSRSVHHDADDRAGDEPAVHAASDKPRRKSTRPIKRGD